MRPAGRADVPYARAAIVADAEATYPHESPFSPSEDYPEYPFPFADIGRVDNPVYRNVRRAFIDARLDEANVGLPSWNPLGRYVRPGGRVFVLCNFVYHRRSRETRADFEAKCVHGSVLRALIDYVRIATGPEGVIEFGNAPLQSCQWPKVLEDSCADGLCGFFADHGVSVTARDLRLFTSASASGTRRHCYRDPSSAVTFDLGEESLLADVSSPAAGPHGRPRVRDYDPDRTDRFHTGTSHKYVVHEAVLRADTVISLPKLKTHEKVGLTCGLKGLVGAVAHKDCLAHHRFGAPKRGGDEFPDRAAAATPLAHFHDWLNRRPPGALWQSGLLAMQALVSGVLRRLGVPLGGAWHGNDTAWRMVGDLYRILRFGDLDGTVRDVAQRRHLVLVDGIVAGEGDGPLSPMPVDCGAVIFADDLPAADRLAWRLMGYRPEALKLLGVPGNGNGEDIRVVQNGRAVGEADVEPLLDRSFRVPRGWQTYLSNWTLR